MTARKATKAAPAGEAPAELTLLARDFRAARRVSTPLLGVQTPDMAATIDTLAAVANGETPVMTWNAVGGLEGYNDLGVKAVRELGVDPAMTLNPTEALLLMRKLPGRSLVFFMNAQRFIGEPGAAGATIVQSIWNLRDVFKKDRRMLVLLGPVLLLPSELDGDVIVLDEPLPTPDECRALIVRQYENAELAAPAVETLDKATDAVMGLPQFTVEQITAMSLTKAGVDLDQLWSRKRAAIEQTPGLSVWRGGETYDQIGGCDNIKQFLDAYIGGRSTMNGVVFIDEIEKMLGGASGPVGDSSGTSQDQLQQLLTFMQDERTPGLIFIGHPGVAKSAIAKATGNTASVPTIQMDLGGMKAGIVGQSEERIRQALKVVKAVTGGRALFIATCNDIKALKPELRRRFKLGTFFFDLPTATERESIWKIYLRKYELAQPGAHVELPNDTNWTGAEIENCCELAWSLGVSLEAASAYIVPIAKAAADRVERLREEADGRFISASEPGPYDMRAAVSGASQETGAAAGKGERKIDLS